jgi:enamine deaminase RidA (YjgF/YER057c/UK114 family)
VTIFITNPNDWAQVNTVYTKMLDTHKPARAVITAAALPKGFHIEMLATAAVKLTA